MSINPVYQGGMNYPEQVTEYFLCCQVCREPGFRDPRLLTCGHVFCARCLDSYAGNGEKGYSIFCPLCKVATPVPRKGVEALPRSRFFDCQVDRLVRRHNKAQGRDDVHYNIRAFSLQKTGFARLH